MVLCNGKFAVPAIQLLAFEHYLCAVAVGDAEPDFTEKIATECSNSQLPFQAFPDVKSMVNMRAWIEEVKPDYIFSICFPFKLKQDVLGYKPNACINFHTGPLPQYRGPMPIFEVLRYGEKNTALTLHYMTEEFDEGAVIFAENLAIEEQETFGSLARKLSELAGYSAKNLAEMLEFGTNVPSSVQNESNARYFEYPLPEDTLIRWDRMPASEIEALVRACNPWNTGADAVLVRQTLKILSVKRVDHVQAILPGEVAYDNEQLLVGCKNNTVLELKMLRTEQGFYTGSDFYIHTIKKMALPRYA